MNEQDTFTLLAEVALKSLAAAGYANLKEAGELHEFDVNEAWHVRMNGDLEDDAQPKWSALVSYHGWPAGLLSPAGGMIAAGTGANEDAFRAALKEALA